MILKYAKIYLIIALTVLSTALKAQDFLVGAGIGGGTFKMNSTKAFNQNIIDLLPFKPEATDNFPPYFFYKGEVLYRFSNFFTAGINLSTTSTGARLSLADYSGKYTLDNVQKGIFPGIKVYLGKALDQSTELNFSLAGGTSFSTMKINEEVSVFDESTTNKQDFNAEGLFVQPGICYFKNIVSNLKIGVEISYYYGFEKGYHFPNERKLINTHTGKPIKPQWDGIRLGITAYWGLRTRSESIQ